MKGDPDLVYRARDLQDLQEIFRYCHQEKIPITLCGSRTGLAGGAAAPGGLLVSMEKKSSFLDLDRTKRTATAEAGILLGEFQKRVAEEGFHYPPDPTSRFEAQLGGTIATNAGGEDSFRYGMTRRYVRRLKILRATGEIDIFERKGPFTGPSKNLGGYPLTKDPIDLLIGSEGTLGLILEATVDLLPPSRSFFAAWAFFPSLESALEFVVRAASDQTVSPRSFELIDKPSLEIVSQQDRAPRATSTAGAAISFKQEYEETNRDELIENWLKLLESVLKRHNAIPLLDEVVVALDEPAQAQLRKLRHAIPATINEEIRPYLEEGGGKISTDWWVPLAKMPQMMEKAREESGVLGLRTLMFAHIGDGHPHINYIAKNFSEMQRAKELLKDQCRRAVQWGGGVAGEHGIGKLYRDLLPLQWSVEQIGRMREIKRQFDPHGILGPGTLF